MLKEMGPFWHEDNEMNEKFSFKICVRLTTSVDMGEDFLDILYEVTYKNAGTELKIDDR